MDNLQKIISQVLNIDISEINDALSRDNTEEWDSFNHLLLISEIEKRLGISIVLSEVERIRTLGELKEIVTKNRE